MIPRCRVWSKINASRRPGTWTSYGLRRSATSAISRGRSARSNRVTNPMPRAIKIPNLQRAGDIEPAEVDLHRRARLYAAVLRTPPPTRRLPATPRRSVAPSAPIGPIIGNSSRRIRLAVTAVPTTAADRNCSAVAATPLDGPRAAQAAAVPFTVPSGVTRRRSGFPGGLREQIERGDRAPSPFEHPLDR